MIVEATQPMLVSLARRLDPRHRVELLREFPSLTAWVKSRSDLPGSIWAFLPRGEVMFVMGVTTQDRTGWLWIAGAEGWSRYARQAKRLWQAIFTSGAYERYGCDVHEDNAPAQRFAEWGGFQFLRREGGRVFYGRTA